MTPTSTIPTALDLVWSPVGKNSLFPDLIPRMWGHFGGIFFFHKFKLKIHLNFTVSGIAKNSIFQILFQALFLFIFIVNVIFHIT